MSLCPGQKCKQPVEGKLINPASFSFTSRVGFLRAGSCGDMKRRELQALQELSEPLYWDLAAFGSHKQGCTVHICVSITKH